MNALIFLCLAADPQVAGWTVSGKNQRASEEYSVELDRKTAHSGSASALLKSKVAAPNETLYLTQGVRSDDYRGKRVRLSGWVKTELEGKTAAGDEKPEGLRLWVNLFGEQGRSLGADVMWNRPITGTTAWARYDLVIDVPADALKLTFGAAMKGKGQAWVDDLKLEVVDEKVAVTGEPALPKSPVNLGFEESH